MITKKDIFNINNISIIDIFLLKNGFISTFLDSFRRVYEKTIEDKDLTFKFEIILMFNSMHHNEIYNDYPAIATIKIIANENKNNNPVNLLPINKFIEPEFVNINVIEKIKTYLTLFDLL